MKQSYALPLVTFAVGLGLIVASTSAGATLPLFGFAVPVQVVRGVGLIAFIFSAIAFLAAYGSTLPPRQTQPSSISDGATHGKTEDISGHRHLPHRA